MLLLFLRITRSTSSDVAVVHITDPCVEDRGVPQACELECRLSTYQTAHRPSAPPPGFRSVTPRMGVADLEGAAERHSIDSNVRLLRGTLKQD